MTFYLFRGQAWGDPGIPLPEGAVLCDLSGGVIISLPSQSVANVDKVFVVDVV